MDRIIFYVVFGITHLIGLFLYFLSGFPFERCIPAFLFELAVLCASGIWLYAIRRNILNNNREKKEKEDETIHS